LQDIPFVADIDIIEVAERLDLDLRKDGDRMKCCCPHGEKAPSLVFYSDNSWFCFGCEAAGQNALDLVKFVRSCDESEALQFLGLQPEPPQDKLTRRLQALHRPPTGISDPHHLVERAEIARRYRSGSLSNLDLREFDTEG
jgi:hypothetical protein